MKTNYLYVVFITLSLLILSNEKAFCQVTIGYYESPAKAGLLQIKSQSADNDNVTSTKGGLILPRVKLVSLSTLEPFIDPASSDYDNQKSLHIGMVIYNAISVTDSKDSSITITSGAYVWNGAKWEKLEID